MTDQKDKQVKDQKDEVQTETPTPTQFTVVVTNTINGVTGDIFMKECEWAKQGSMMKGVRQRIRDMGTSIRDATVTFSDDKSHQTIAFTELVISERKVAQAGRTQSNAQKNAAETVASEVDQEIIGIAKDDGISKETRTETLMGYSRHQLIKGYNTHCEDKDQRLNHYSTKVQAVEALLS